jgi:hypothetical protein
MIRALAIAATLSLALPAAAATSVKVNLSGLDANGAHTAILRAAKAACRTELRDASTFEFHYQWTDCLKSADARAQSDLKTLAAAPTTPDHRLAGH